MKLRTGEPWMPAPDYGRSLHGLTVNLLVSNIDAALAFQRNVLDARVVYADADFAVLSSCGGEWMLHADHTYRGHPLHDEASAVTARGSGIELRLHGRNPDAAAAAARAHGHVVLADPADKPHGLREAFIADPDGYVWVPDIPSRA
jgi:catechol 2,3-dioxygenase-like lactoylglutathione lyase family enzyme